MEVSILSLVCNKYAKRIGNEVGWSDMLLEDKLDEVIPNIKEEYRDAITNLNIQAKQGSYKKSIIYLLSLFESFMQDFILEKENNSTKEIKIKELLIDDIKEWKLYCDTEDSAISTSTSFMNIRYSLFILKRRYEIEYPTELTNLVFELGSLRNCIVHHNGNISHIDKGGKCLFRDTLEKTIDFLKMNKNENNICEFITYDYVNKVTFDLQKFIERCGNF